MKFPSPIKQLTCAALFLLLATSAAAGAKLTNRYAFDSDADDEVGSLDGLLSFDNGSDTIEPQFTENTPDRADTSFAEGSILLGAGKDNQSESTGLASYVNFMSFAIFDGKAGSYALWFRPTAPGFQQDIFSNITVGGIGQLRSFYTGIERLQLASSVILPTPPFTTIQTATPGRWNHLVVTWNDEAGNGTIAVNGMVESFTFTAGGLEDPARMMLGNFSTKNNAMQTQFVGEIYDLQVYEGELSPEEILKLFSKPGTAIK